MNQTPQGMKSSEIRRWAVDNGFPQLAGKNGRLPAQAIAAYLNRHPLTADAPPSPEVQ